MDYSWFKYYSRKVALILLRQGGGAGMVIVCGKPAELIFERSLTSKNHDVLTTKMCLIFF